MISFLRWWWWRDEIGNRRVKAQTRKYECVNVNGHTSLVGRFHGLPPVSSLTHSTSCQEGEDEVGGESAAADADADADAVCAFSDDGGAAAAAEAWMCQAGSSTCHAFIRSCILPRLYRKRGASPRYTCGFARGQSLVVRDESDE